MSILNEIAQWLCLGGLGLFLWLISSDMERAIDKINSARAALAPRDGGSDAV